MEKDSSPEKLYTQAEFDAMRKFLNGCITRQFAIIQRLRNLLKECEGRAK